MENKIKLYTTINYFWAIYSDAEQTKLICENKITLYFLANECSLIQFGGW